MTAVAAATPWTWSAYSTALTFNINTATSGTVSAVTGSFNNMEVLDGGSGGNTFNINASTSDSLNGGAGADDYVFANGKHPDRIDINGKGGSDTLDFSAYTTAVNVTAHRVWAAPMASTAPPPAPPIPSLVPSATST